MSHYFADAWYFIARLDRADAHHAAALRVGHALRAMTLVTHEGVLTEVLAYFSGYGQKMREAAAKIVRETMHSGVVAHADHLLFLVALDLYEGRPDKQYSLVDCMSMVVMRAKGITQVVTNDHHFRQEGFTVLSGAS
jgi:predicted nucleic acid-binding protein